MIGLSKLNLATPSYDVFYSWKKKGMGTLSIFRLAQSNFQNVIAKHNHESGDSLADAINVLRARRLRL